MPALFEPGTMVTVKTASTVPVAGHPGPHIGKVGKVRGYVDLAPLFKGGDVIHIVDLAYREAANKPWVWYGERFAVPNETPNPPEYGPQGPTGRKIHGDSLPDQEVHWIEMPASCLS